MQPFERTDHFLKSHRTTGEVKNIPPELDPHARSRALTLVEAKHIIDALDDAMLPVVEQKPHVEMFTPVAPAAPSSQGSEVVPRARKTSDEPTTPGDVALSSEQLRALFNIPEAA